MHRRRLAISVALASASAVALTGCSSAEADAPGDGRIQVVASTDVYAQIAEEIGGEFIDATAIVSSSAQDPHSFEPSARDQLTVQRADLIIENGGGYDAFVGPLVEASGSTAPVITAAEFSDAWTGADGEDAGAAEDGHTGHTEGESSDPVEDADGDHSDHGHVEGFNEHVWYDPRTMEHLAAEITAQLSDLLPAESATFEANAAAFAAGIGDIETALSGIDAAHAGEQVFVTEPVPLYLVAAAGLDQVKHRPHPGGLRSCRRDQDGAGDAAGGAAQDPARR